MMEKKQKPVTDEIKKEQTEAKKVTENQLEKEDVAAKDTSNSEMETEVTEIPVEVEVEETEAEENTEAEGEAEKPEEDLTQKYLQQLQMLQAEFQNYKKRVEREKKEISRYIKGDFIRKLLPVIDDLDRSLQNHEDEKEFEGFRLINEKLMLILKEEGLEEVAAGGNDFDPNYHDALYTQEVEDEADDGKVLEEWEKGYFFQGTLLRPSKVKVGKIKEES